MGEFGESKEIEYEKIWECKSCGHRFIPNRPDFSCLKCKRGNTFPTQEVSTKPKPLAVKEIEPVREIEEDHGTQRFESSFFVKNPHQRTKIFNDKTRDEFLEEYPHKYMLIVDSSQGIKGFGILFDNLPKAINILEKKGWRCHSYELVCPGNYVVGHALMEKSEDSS